MAHRSPFARNNARTESLIPPLAMARAYRVRDQSSLPSGRMAFTEAKAQTPCTLRAVTVRSTGGPSSRSTGMRMLSIMAARTGEPKRFFNHRRINIGRFFVAG